MRWIEFGGLQLQPSELTKVALVLALASWFHRASWERTGNPFFLIPPVGAILVPVALILKDHLAPADSPHDRLAIDVTDAALEKELLTSKGNQSDKTFRQLLADINMMV